MFQDEVNDLTIHIDGLMKERSELMKTNAALKSALKKVKGSQEERARSMEKLEAELASSKTEIALLVDKLRQREDLLAHTKQEHRTSLSVLDETKRAMQQLSQVMN